MKRWVSKRCNADLAKIASRYNVTEIFAEILVKRGLYTWEAMDKYLFPDLELMYNPGLMKGLEELIEERTGITTMTAEDPMTAVAVGTGKFVEFLSGKRDDND